MKTALVLEGGALRTIFSAGVCDSLLDAGLPLPDYTVGVSAGIAYGASYLSRQSRRNLRLITSYVRDPRYMALRNWVNPRNRSYFGLEFAYETIPNQLIPFDYNAFEAYPGTVEAVVTNLDTGLAEYLPVPRRDEHNLLLQATCAIPLMFPVYHLEGRPYLDGGCADAIPWRRAFETGCDRVVVILTRERDFRKRSDKSLRVLERTFRQPCAPGRSDTTGPGKSSSPWSGPGRSWSSPRRTPWAVPGRSGIWTPCGPCGSRGILWAAAPRRISASSGRRMGADPPGRLRANAAQSFSILSVLHIFFSDN